MTFTPKKKIGYFYDPDVGNYYYAQGHPMKPHRMRMTHNLLVAYGTLNRMDVLPTPRANDRDMTRFHSDEYINFLRSVTPDSLQDQLHTLCRFNVLEDCPVFDGLWEYCQIAAGGSLAGAARLNSGESNVAINWAGGLHHAKKAEASGFCYINDCVLAILELLKHHARVLYVDIDIHHGDGVEEAFYTTDRVMTASFHKFGDYFPGTGHANDIGIGRGKHYSANFPLRDGIDDETYREIFMPVMSRIMEWYRPGAVVLQCGADSLSGDRLGCFNLSLHGHSQCVDFFKQYDVPLLLLGGGGYTVRNVARCWAYETSRVVGETLSDDLPFNENYEFYGPDFRLHITPSNMENHNSRAELEKIKMRIIENLRHLPHAPSTPFIDAPRISPLAVHRRDYDSEDENPDVRFKSRRAKAVVDYAGSDDEDDDQYISSLRHAKKRAKRMNFPRRRFPSASIGIDSYEKTTRILSVEREDYSPRLRNINRPQRGEVILGRDIVQGIEMPLPPSQEPITDLNGQRTHRAQFSADAEQRDGSNPPQREEAVGSDDEKHPFEPRLENGVPTNPAQRKSLVDAMETPSRQNKDNMSSMNQQSNVDGMDIDGGPGDSGERQLRPRAVDMNAEQRSSSMHPQNGEGNSQNLHARIEPSQNTNDNFRQQSLSQEHEQSTGAGNRMEGGEVVRQHTDGATENVSNWKGFHEQKQVEGQRNVGAEGKWNTRPLSNHAEVRYEIDTGKQLRGANVGAGSVNDAATMNETERLREVEEHNATPHERGKQRDIPSDADEGSAHPVLVQNIATSVEQHSGNVDRTHYGKTEIKPVNGLGSSREFNRVKG